MNLKYNVFPIAIERSFMDHAVVYAGMLITATLWLSCLGAW